MSPHWTTTLLIRRKVFTKTKRRVSQVTQRQKMKLSLERFFHRARGRFPHSAKRPRAICDSLSSRRPTYLLVCQYLSSAQSVDCFCRRIKGIFRAPTYLLTERVLGESGARLRRRRRHYKETQTRLRECFTGASFVCFAASMVACVLFFIALEIVNKVSRRG